MIKEIPQKKLMVSLLILTILISVFGTLAVLDATRGLAPKTTEQEQSTAEEPVEQLSQTGIISFAVLERPEE